MSTNKKFKDTTVGKILLGAAGLVNPTLGNVLSGVLSPAEALQEISKSKLTTEDKIKLQTLLVEAQQTEEEEITKRAIADAQSDSKLAQNIRPLTYLFFIALFSFSMVLDSVETIPFDISDQQLDVIQGTLFAMTGFYFGGRSLEKIMKAYKQT